MWDYAGPSDAQEATVAGEQSRSGRLGGVGGGRLGKSDRPVKPAERIWL